VIPRDYPVVQTQDGVGEIQVVVAWRRQSLQHCPIVIREVAGDPALEGRQSRYRGNPVRIQEPAGLFERRDSAASLGANDCNWCRGEEGEATEPLGIGRTVEKEQMWLSQEALRGRNRIRRGVQFFDDWDVDHAA
jgi:hypothetical protein